jgi:hypothetical protein
MMSVSYTTLDVFLSFRLHMYTLEQIAFTYSSNISTRTLATFQYMAGHKRLRSVYFNFEQKYECKETELIPIVWLTK